MVETFSGMRTSCNHPTCNDKSLQFQQHLSLEEVLPDLAQGGVDWRLQQLGGR